MNTLTKTDIADAARMLGCEPAALEAVCDVEAPYGGFLATGEPAILFERHWFSRLTGHRFDAQHPDISNRTPGGYKGGRAEHERLARAVALNREAALMSASWGRFQIMGGNYKQAGFSTLQGFINAMYRSERAQLDAFVNFIRNDPRLTSALRTLAFTAFAKAYNGPNYAQNRYDEKLRDAYRRRVNA